MSLPPPKTSEDYSWITPEFCEKLRREAGGELSSDWPPATGKSGGDRMRELEALGFTDGCILAIIWTEIERRVDGLDKPPWRKPGFNYPYPIESPRIESPPLAP
jgi:hypothetical protein